jgi:hypothetical protein
MNNEPVAWMKEVEDGTMYTNYEYLGSIPLYTHPAKYCPSENNEAYEKGFIDGMAKQRDSRVQQMVEGYAQMRELTDDEIRILINEVPDYNIDIHDLMEFARAILRKAQEK